MRKVMWVLQALGFLFFVWLCFPSGYIAFVMFSVFVTLLGVPYAIARVFAASCILAVPMIVIVLWIWCRVAPAKKI